MPEEVSYLDREEVLYLFYDALYDFPGFSVRPGHGIEPGICHCRDEVLYCCEGGCDAVFNFCNFIHHGRLQVRPYFRDLLSEVYKEFLYLVSVLFPYFEDGYHGYHGSYYCEERSCGYSADYSADGCECSGRHAHHIYDCAYSCGQFSYYHQDRSYDRCEHSYLSDELFCPVIEIAPPFR